MIYYLMAIAAGVLIDFKDLKESSKKSDIIFYIIAILLCVAIGIFYFADTNRDGLAEIFIKMFGLGGT